jgi:hypothetical protein
MKGVEDEHKASDRRRRAVGGRVGSRLHAVVPDHRLLAPATMSEARRPPAGLPPELTLFDQMCTETEDCPALADAHRKSCPVEHELIEEFGF